TAACASHSRAWARFASRHRRGVAVAARHCGRGDRPCRCVAGLANQSRMLSCTAASARSLRAPDLRPEFKDPSAWPLSSPSLCTSCSHSRRAASSPPPAAPALSPLIVVLAAAAPGRKSTVVPAVSVRDAYIGGLAHGEAALWLIVQRHDK